MVFKIVIVCERGMGTGEGSCKMGGEASYMRGLYTLSMEESEGEGNGDGMEENV